MPGPGPGPGPDCRCPPLESHAWWPSCSPRGRSWQSWPLRERWPGGKSQPPQLRSGGKRGRTRARGTQAGDLGVPLRPLHNLQCGEGGQRSERYSGAHQKGGWGELCKTQRPGDRCVQGQEMLQNVDPNPHPPVAALTHITSAETRPTWGRCIISSSNPEGSS